MSEEKLHILYDKNTIDVPAKMDVLAGDIKAGVYGKVVMCSVVTMDSNGMVEVFGLGDNDIFKTISLLEIGKGKLVADMVEGDE